MVVRKGRSGGTVWGGLTGRRPVLLGRYCSPPARGTYGGALAEVAVSDTRVAFVRETCSAGKPVERRVTVRDLSPDGDEEIVAPTKYTAVDLAGDFVAYHDATDPALIFVHSLKTQAIAYGISQEDVLGTDLQGDGTLLVGSLFPSSEDDVLRYSWGDQRGRRSDKCTSGDQIAIDSDRIACIGWGYADRYPSLYVVDLRGKAQAQVTLRRDPVEVDIRGPRVAYATRGCSKGETKLWLVVFTKKKRLPLPAASACRR